MYYRWPIHTHQVPRSLSSPFFKLHRTSACCGGGLWRRWRCHHWPFWISNKVKHCNFDDLIWTLIKTTYNRVCDLAQGLTKNFRVQLLAKWPPYQVAFSSFCIGKFCISFVFCIFCIGLFLAFFIWLFLASWFLQFLQFFCTSQFLSLLKVASIFGGWTLFAISFFFFR